MVATLNGFTGDRSAPLPRLPVFLLGGTHLPVIFVERLRYPQGHRRRTCRAVSRPYAAMFDEETGGAVRGQRNRGRCHRFAVGTSLHAPFKGCQNDLRAPFRSSISSWQSPVSGGEHGLSRNRLSDRLEYRDATAPGG